MGIVCNQDLRPRNPGNPGTSRRNPGTQDPKTQDPVTETLGLWNHDPEHKNSRTRTLRVEL